jgi:hypothetical protein
VKAVRCSLAIVRVVVLAAVLVVGASHAQTARTPVEQAFIGVYTLAVYAPHGESPIGRIAYDGSGRMWAMITPPGRAPVSNESSDGDFRAAMQGLIAYWGRYEIDEAGGRVIHFVEAASNPAWIGDEFVRWYRIDGQRLTLSLNPNFTNMLIWERLPD